MFNTFAVLIGRHVSTNTCLPYISQVRGHSKFCFWKFSTKAILTVCLGTFPFDRLTDVKTEDLAMASLVISEETSDIVQAVCHAQSHPFQVEYIWSKGEGQIILLHGRVCLLFGEERV